MVNPQLPMDAVIKKYDSNREAIDDGWRITDHWYFSPDGKDVWVCPDCVDRKPEAFK